MRYEALKFCEPDEALMEDIAGVDEAGRGPLAGNVVAAAVILDPRRIPAGLNDSKKLSAARRESLCEEIQQRALSFSVAEASVEEIDRLNILQASLLAMRRAIQDLSRMPAFVYVDGNCCPDWEYASRALVKGDNRILCIAAASILAKVYRDKSLLELHKQYPQYGFDRHKGYPTPEHLEALQEFGVTAVHRRSYAPVRAVLNLK
jgi:ribonuclease HII